MKSRFAMLLPCLVILAWVAAGCGGGAPAPVADPNDVSATWPEYMEKVPADADFHLASATATSPDAQMAIKKAELTAQAELATMVSAVVQDRMREISEDVGSGDDAQFRAKVVAANERTVNEVIKGVRTREKKVVREGAGYRSFVLVEVPKRSADEALMGAVAQDEELRTRFRASKTFQDIEARFK